MTTYMGTEYVALYMVGDLVGGKVETGSGVVQSIARWRLDNSTQSCELQPEEGGLVNDSSTKFILHLAVNRGPR